ncbi:MAG: efflux RND transporter permease subunit [Gemmataceae bacterium]
MADKNGRPIPLEQLASLKLEDGPAQVSRDAIRRRIIIQCNVRGRDLAGFVGEAKQKVERDVKLPSGYTLTWGGTFKNLQEASARLAVAVPVALVMIFVLLHSTFNSSKLAMLIFLNVPMAATGGIFALALRRAAVLHLRGRRLHRIIRCGRAQRRGARDLHRGPSQVRPAGHRCGF